MVKTVWIALAILVALGAAVAYFYFNYVWPAPVTPPPTTGAAVPAQDAGLLTYDVVVGTGVEVTADPVHLTLLYTGSYGDGTVFDSTHSQTALYYFTGQSDAPLGWNEGLVGMKVGGTRIITIYPGYAGRAKFAQTFPADATVEYKVTLLNMIDTGQGEVHTPPPPGIPAVQPGF